MIQIRICDDCGEPFPCGIFPLRRCELCAMKQPGVDYVYRDGKGQIDD